MLSSIGSYVFRKSLSRWDFIAMAVAAYTYVLLDIGMGWILLWIVVSAIFGSIMENACT